VSDEEIQGALKRCPEKLRDALRLAADRIRTFQQSILVSDPEPVQVDGRFCGIRYLPVDSTGIYVPGGAASLASSVLMAAVPARVAGVQRVVMVTPPRADGTVSDDRLAAAAIAGVDEVYRMGSAWAIAALAYGTQSVQPVDFIVGPGSIYATLAKREVFGQVGIEMLPGPSEIVVLADSSARPEHVAADMLSQAEHDPGSAVLLTDDAELAGRTVNELERQVARLPRSEKARRGLDEYGAVIVAESIERCVDLANELAPEHLEVATRDAETVAQGIRHAGAIFLGHWTPEAVGDYVAGPSHILPTGGTARFSSGLSCNDFLKRTSMIRYEAGALAADAPAIVEIARAEGLEGHAQSVDVRTRG
jgi:histidinol dehydrogenase